MTKVQIWLTAVLAAFLLLFLLGRALKKDEPASPETTENTVPQSDNMSSENITGQELMIRLGCGSCHGREFEGTQMAPALQNLSQYWSRDKLINYLRNPSSYNDERFEEYRKKYPNIIMPSYGHVDVKDLGKIAEYLLMR